MEWLAVGIGIAVGIVALLTLCAVNLLVYMGVRELLKAPQASETVKYVYYEDEEPGVYDPEVEEAKEFATEAERLSRLEEMARDLSMTQEDIVAGLGGKR